MTKSEQAQSDILTELLRKGLGEGLTEEEQEQREQVKKNRERRKKLASEAI